MKKSYCMKCKKEVGEEITQCECGSRSFVFGANLLFEDDQIKCKCGNTKFKNTMHMDFTNKAVSNYVCGCGNVIGTEYYRSEEEMMYWE